MSLAQKAFALGERLVLSIERIALLLEQRPPLRADYLTAHGAATALETAPELLNRKEASALLNVDPRTFDKSLRPKLTDHGNNTNPLFSTREILKCLDAETSPGYFANNQRVKTGSSGSHIKTAISRNPQAQAMKLRLIDSQQISTNKSSRDNTKGPPE